jgi:hypothetical protein
MSKFFISTAFIFSSATTLSAGDIENLLRALQSQNGIQQLERSPNLAQAVNKLGERLGSTNHVHVAATNSPTVVTNQISPIKQNIMSIRSNLAAMRRQPSELKSVALGQNSGTNLTVSSNLVHVQVVENPKENPKIPVVLVEDIKK